MHNGGCPSCPTKNCLLRAGEREPHVIKKNGPHYLKSRFCYNECPFGGLGAVILAFLRLYQSAIFKLPRPEVSDRQDPEINLLDRLKQLVRDTTACLVAQRRGPVSVGEGGSEENIPFLASRFHDHCRTMLCDGSEAKIKMPLAGGPVLTLRDSSRPKGSLLVEMVERMATCWSH